MQKIKIDVSRQYDVILGKDILQNLPALLRERAITGKTIVITDNNVDKLYKIPSDLKFVIPHGEESKNLKTYSDIMEFLSTSRIQRRDTIIALGGGVVGDLAGFVAATYLRGIRFVQIPTTLLSIIDSSVGGKTGVNLPSGKNLVGAFWQPSLVIADITTLKTLPKAETLNGLGEMVKYGIILGGELWTLVKIIRGDFFGNLTESEIIRAIQLCIECKKKIVEKDEFEITGERAILNLGHTVGHAIEKLSNFEISHGIAVTTGIAAITDNKEILEVLQENDLIAAHSYDKKAVISAIMSDKKAFGDNILLEKIIDVGDCRMVETPIEKIKEILK